MKLWMMAVAQIILAAYSTSFTRILSRTQNRFFQIPQARSTMDLVRVWFLNNSGFRKNSKKATSSIAGEDLVLPEPWGPSTVAFGRRYPLQKHHVNQNFQKVPPQQYCIRKRSPPVLESVEYGTITHHSRVIHSAGPFCVDVKEVRAWPTNEHCVYGVPMVTIKILCLVLKGRYNLNMGPIHYATYVRDARIGHGLKAPRNFLEKSRLLGPPCSGQGM